jgi:hypothetical protein
MNKDEIDAIQSLNTSLTNLKKTALKFEEGVEGISKERRKGLDDEIKLLKEKLQIIKDSEEIDTKTKKEAEKNYKRIVRLNRTLKEQFQVVGRITNEVAVTGQKYKDFLMSTGAQYNLAQKIAVTYKGLVKTLGLGGRSAKLMTESFKGALPDVIEMGLKQEDLREIYKEMAETSGRITPVTEEDAKAIAAVAAGTGIMASDATGMAESFNLMGVSSQKMEKMLMETYKGAKAMGLNSTKVIQTLQKNMKSMQEYSFSSGVKGMTSMAKQAVKMRLDVSDVLQMADKFYQPEAAIEAAANLQMLGGDIAEAFGDPFETMYLARNKPEELAKKLGKMTENMMQFNETSGEYEFPAEVRMQLQAAGKELGINTKSMIEMARQTSKIKDIKMKFSSIGDMETKENLASLAQWSESRGEFVVKHNGEDLGLSSITDSMAEEIQQANQSPEETFRDIAINTQSMSEKMDNFGKAQDAKAVTATNIYEIATKEIDKTFVSVRESMKKSTEAWISKGSAMIEGMFADSGESDTIKDLNEGFGKLTTSIKEGTIKSFNQLSTVMNNFGETWGELPDPSNNTTENPYSMYTTKESCDKQTGAVWKDGKCQQKAEDLISYPGSKRTVTGSFGDFSLDDRDMLIAGDPKKIGGNSNNAPSEMKVSGTATINVNINSNTAISANMESQLTSKIIEVYQKIANGNGDPSSVYQPQPSKGSGILYA